MTNYVIHTFGFDSSTFWICADKWFFSQQIKVTLICCNIAIGSESFAHGIIDETILVLWLITLKPPVQWYRKT